MQTRSEITRIVEADRQNWKREVCSILAWILIMASCFMCCTCCVKALCRCCGPTERVVIEPVIVEGSAEPSAPVDTEDAELEMALMLSAAETKVVHGIPVKSMKTTAH